MPLRPLPPDFLPIDPLLPEVARTVSAHPLTLLEAEPGAGKTTRVPPALLKAGLGPIYVLEPRRLAARLAARRVAFEMGEPLGGTVGYRVRFEESSSSKTQIWYVTEGVLVRTLLADREFLYRGVFVLDEFHERHLETDLALVLLRQKSTEYPDLRVVLMSATLPADLRGRLGDPPLLKAPGRVFPVSVGYTPASSSPLEEQVAAVISTALTRTEGHVLVFLPGAAEIRKAMRACEGVAKRADADVLPLHGDLSPEEQDRAVLPGERRKIICSTNVAESSVTIEGVGAVIDSGLARVRTHSSWSGFSRLHIQKISRSSAVQRAGRAGRTGPGVAYRLYSEAEFVRLSEYLRPEIARSELSDAVLLLAAHGLRIDELPWLDPPPAAAVAEAHALLGRLAALDADAAITAFGRRMARLPLHPRLACFVSRASALGAGREACELAARLAEESNLRTDPAQAASFASDIEALLASVPSQPARRLKERLLRAVDRRADRSTADPDAIEKALLLAYPDRVARRRGDTLLLAGGGSARLDRSSRVTSEFLLALDIDDRSAGETPLVRLASHVEPDWLLELFPDLIQAREELVWNRHAERVEQMNVLLYEQLPLDESSGPPSDAAAAARLLATKAFEEGVARFANPDSLGRFLARIRFAAQHAPFDLSAEFVESALTDLAQGLSSFRELRAAAESDALLARMESQLPMRTVQEVAPAFLELPSGRRVRVDYHEDRPPSVASRLQDFFGLQQTPAVARGSVPVTVQLLAPNRRPVQVTTDLTSFWKNLYPQLRRELSRRYPKHAWPENPR